MPTLTTRDELIADCAALYGVDPHVFQVMDQPTLEHAWIIARGHWT